MAESDGIGMDFELSGEFRRRQPSFHSCLSRSAPKRSAARPLDWDLFESHMPQRPRLEEGIISSKLLVRGAMEQASTMLGEEATDSDGASSDTPMEGTDGTSGRTSANGTDSSDHSRVPSDMTDASTPSMETPPGSPEDSDEPQRIVRPEDISLHNPDSGLGYRASQNEYHTDDSDDGLEEDEDEESEKEDGEVTEPDEFPPSHPSSPCPDGEHDDYVPRSPSPDRFDEDFDGLRSESTLPYSTPLDLQMSFDPTVHMGLLMIDPSHQYRFNELHRPMSSSGSSTAYDTLLREYENVNAIRFEQLENALMLNTELDDLEEIVEVIEEEDGPPANPPSSPAFPS
ncbi:hypothetical protein PENTCL1PPCAC_28816 [Pristionchus entomophagus]|uniref:Uncharacterized protein n=1 Tax=Pristionchus entomophagus TaxID=358040 RepID=A0AAV5UJY5_9BILA|nr:hypothetical protein PENTCL1PPCAC_28816 [Pristionchus entomophagus]